MFGEESMYGQITVKRDNKGRIFLPSFTYAEKDDSLLIIRNEIDNLIEIYSEDQINKLIEAYELKIDNAKDIDEKKYYRKTLLMIFSSILKKVKCDSQHRINVNGICNEKSNIKLIGAKNHIKLFSTKE